jgi:hypothetical protein
MFQEGLKQDMEDEEILDASLNESLQKEDLHSGKCKTLDIDREIPLATLISNKTEM